MIPITIHFIRKKQKKKTLERRRKANTIKCWNEEGTVSKKETEHHQLTRIREVNHIPSMKNKQDHQTSEYLNDNPLFII